MYVCVSHVFELRTFYVLGINEERSKKEAVFQAFVIVKLFTVTLFRIIVDSSNITCSLIFERYIIFAPGVKSNANL